MAAKVSTTNRVAAVRLALVAATTVAVYRGASAPANAVTYPVPGTYIVTGTLNDGGTVSGEFTINVYGYLSAPTSVTTTPGSVLGGQAYTIPPLNPNFQPITFASSVQFTYNYSPTLQITFLNPIGAGVVDPILIGFANAGNSFECDVGLGGYCTNGFDPTTGRYFLSGEAVATPLPAALPLFVGGLGVVSLLARRRKRKHAAALAAA